MATGATTSMRIPFILLVLANLTVLGMRLWPWQGVMSLPGNGTTALDPAVTLLGYMGFVIWMKGSSEDPSQKALSAGTLFGLATGFILVAEIMFEGRLALISPLLQIGMLGVAAILCGVGGLRGGKVAGNAGFGMLAGAWSAMLGCLMACSAILAQMYLAAAPQPVTQDPWKDYQGLAIGNPAVQALVHSLNTATGFLLIGPLVGAVMGLVFAFFGQSQKG